MLLSMHRARLSYAEERSRAKYPLINPM
jgi:hypothetical protein